MSLPPSWSTVRVFGTYLCLDGSPARGAVMFNASSVVKVALPGGQDVIVMPKMIEVTLDAAGAFEVYLPTTDDPDISPTGWVYHVRESIAGGREFDMFAEGGGDINLTTVLPVAPVAEVASIRGPPGPRGADGADGADSTVPGPPGPPSTVPGPEGPRGPTSSAILSGALLIAVVNAVPVPADPNTVYIVVEGTPRPPGPAGSVLSGANLIAVVSALPSPADPNTVYIIKP